MAHPTCADWALTSLLPRIVADHTPKSPFTKSGPSSPPPVGRAAPPPSLLGHVISQCFGSARRSCTAPHFPRRYRVSKFGPFHSKCQEKWPPDWPSPRVLMTVAPVRRGANCQTAGRGRRSQRPATILSERTNVNPLICAQTNAKPRQFSA
jgi:hypothetical protein